MGEGKLQQTFPCHHPICSGRWEDDSSESKQVSLLPSITPTMYVLDLYKISYKNSPHDFTVTISPHIPFFTLFAMLQRLDSYYGSGW